MKRNLINLSWIILLMTVSCFQPPEYSNVPAVKIDKVYGKEVGGAATPDSLIIITSFTDGDGNVGLDGSEIDPPFNERWFYLTAPTPVCEPGVPAPCTRISYVDPGNLNKYVTYKLKRTNPEYADLPEFAPPFDCLNYYVLRNTTTNQIIDTLYSDLNERYNNFFVDLYTIQNDNDPSTIIDTVKYNFNNAAYPKCDIYGLNGRLPVLAKNGDFSLNLPLDGVITYKVVSPSFYSVLRNKTLRVKVRMMDRNGNTSNEYLSTDFILN